MINYIIVSKNEKGKLIFLYNTNKNSNKIKINLNNYNKSNTNLKNYSIIKNIFKNNINKNSDINGNIIKEEINIYDKSDLNIKINLNNVNENTNLSNSEENDSEISEDKGETILFDINYKDKLKSFDKLKNSEIIKLYNDRNKKIKYGDIYSYILSKKDDSRKWPEYIIKEKKY